MCTVGVLRDVDAAELKRDLDAVFEGFKRLCNDPDVRKDVDRFARVSGYLTAEDLETQFTC